LLCFAADAGMQLPAPCTAMPVASGVPLQRHKYAASGCCYQVDNAVQEDSKQRRLDAASCSSMSCSGWLLAAVQASCRLPERRSCLVLLPPCSGTHCSRRPCVLCPCVVVWLVCPQRGGPWWPAPQTPQPAGHRATGTTGGSWLRL
jgi:hypothetical protein